MVLFNYEIDFKLADELIISKWIEEVIKSYGFSTGEINYIFCNDEYLLKLNQKYLQHDTFTDIISFDYTMGKLISGDIFISIERVRENALKFTQTIENELNRVIIHGILHFLHFRDKTADEKQVMRSEENKCLLLLTN